MASSETILTTTTHPGDSTTETVNGDAFKGDGYYSRADGFHTVQINVTGFIGTVTIQATLATNPGADDWFGIVTHTSTGSEETEATGSFLYNFTGNYVWVRATVEYTDGIVNSIQLNH